MNAFGRWKVSATVPFACSVALLAACSTTASEDATTPSVKSPGTAVASPEESPSGIRGCVPECSEGFIAAGPLPVGDYTTVYFLDGQLTVSYAEPWESTEDQGVEFASGPRGESDVHRVVFWDDILPVDDHGQRVSGVPITAAGLLRWFRTDPRFDVSGEQQAMIGRDIPATVIDLTTAPDAKNQDPGCPYDVCVSVFTWPNVGEALGIGGPETLRLYLADVSYGGRTHLLVAAIQARSKQNLTAFLPAAEQVIASARAPVTPA
jgi:hypothetical protein